VAAGEAVLGVAEPARPFVVGAGAGLLLVWRDDSLVAVPAESARCTVLRSIDGARRQWAVEDFTESTVLVHGDATQALSELVTARGATAAGAVLVGVADRLVTMAAEYAKDRSQFGRAIGSFQAVKHHLANAFVRLEFARPVVYRAAWSLDEGEPTAGRDASMAKAIASDAASLAARVALQVHGAIGYTWEHDLHLWMKRAWSLGSSWGDAGWHRARVLGQLVAPA
jgi:alkylation response protein AidB-like acyl-CoA dehydrogenase